MKHKIKVSICSGSTPPTHQSVEDTTEYTVSLPAPILGTASTLIKHLPREQSRNIKIGKIINTRHEVTTGSHMHESQTLNDNKTVIAGPTILEYISFFLAALLRFCGSQQWILLDLHEAHAINASHCEIYQQEKHAISCGLSRKRFCWIRVIRCTFNTS